MARRGPFTVLSGSTVMARVPLLPVARDTGRAGSVVPLLVEAMFLASRQAGMVTAVAGVAVHPRLAVTVRAYELRARFRPTPHGVFAGAAVAGVAAGDVELRLGGRHRVRSRPSGAWLATFVDSVLPDVLQVLTFTTSNLVIRRGGRLEHEQQARPDVAAPQQVSIRATDACVLILRACERGASYSALAAKVLRRWPDVPEETIRGTVLTLVRGGFLLTDLLPGSDQGDPLGHVLANLPGRCSVHEPLERLRGHLRAADRSPPGASRRLAELTGARAVCDDLAWVERPLSADVVADAQVTVPAALLEEAAEAVGVLWRVSRAGDALADYHRRFLEWYGPGRFVPLLEVADAVVGLGDFDAEPVTQIDARPPERVAILAGLLHEAVAYDRVEVQLDEATVDALDANRVDLPPPATAEVYARVVAASEQDLAAGRLSLTIYGGGTQQAGSTVGRFAALLPDAKAGAGVDDSVLLAELAVRPRTPVLAGVSPPSGFVPARIPIGVPPRGGDLDLRNLLLVSNGDRLMLWSAERAQQVVPVLYSRIGPRYIPPLARLLRELGAHGCRPWHGWSWEPLHHWPFQPRLRYRQTIISAARWRLPTAVTAAARDRSQWAAALTSWQATTAPQPPNVVVVEDADRHLPVDLRRDDDRELLRRYVRRGVATVIEQPGGSEAVQAVVDGPTGRHILELVIPLARRVAAAPKVPRVAADPRAYGDGLHLPGSRWLSLAIPSPGACQDEILRQLAGLVTGLRDSFDRWFWLRYHNRVHGPNLRVRFHGDPAVLGGRLLPALSAWCSDLIAQRLASGYTVEPYEQEVERYGGPEAVEAAERVFDADSRLVLAALATPSDDDHRLVVAALSAATIACAVADCDLAALDGRRVGRAARRRIGQLRPLVRAAAESGSTVISCIRPAWADRDAAMADYRDLLPDTRRAGCASSLIHMHANRILGGRESERIARALAADLLIREAMT